MAWNVRHLVSKKKKRFIEDGFDLDLTYIKPNIVAMGFPAEKLEGVYRNNIDEVVRFLETKHKDHYKLYNLCSEKSYDITKFQSRVAAFPFDDHAAPPFELIEPFCNDVQKFLTSDPKNVAVIHCKAGKGRTGVMISSYLLHTGYSENTKDALRFYGDARTLNNKGVTIPSQRRYVEYYGHFMRQNLRYSPETILMCSFELSTVPNINNGSCSPYFIIWQRGVKLYQSKVFEVIKKSSKRITCDLHSPIPVCGDIKVEFVHKDYFTKERMFIFWFNTYFVKCGYTPDKPDGGGEKNLLERDGEGSEYRIFTLSKEDLDKANKDKKHKIYQPDFQLRVKICVPDSSSTSDLTDELPTFTKTRRADVDVQSIDEGVDDELSEEETDEWADEKQGGKQATVALSKPDDLQINETRVYESGDICSRV